MDMVSGALTCSMRYAAIAPRRRCGARHRLPDRREKPASDSMNMTQRVFLGFLFSGILLLLVSLLLTRIHWRADIAPYGRRTRLLQVTMHPEKYTRDAPLRVIRVLSFVGILLLAGAAALVIRELFRARVRP